MFHSKRVRTRVGSTILCAGLILAARFSADAQVTGVSLLPPSASFEAAGGTGSISISVPDSNFVWSASTVTPWITITGNTSGTGDGSINYSVAANTSPNSRSGSITISGAVFSITQAGAAGSTVQVGSYPTLVPGEGQTVDVSVTATVTWVATPSVSWVRITAPANGSGSGNGTLTYVVDANTGSSSRSAAISINGSNLIQFTQSGLTTLTFNPASLSVAAAGATGSVRVTNNPVAPLVDWVPATTATTWITLGAGGRGNGTFTYSIAANTATSARTATITFGAGLPTLAVTQAAAVPPLSEGLHFVPVTPCRLVDTRESNLGAFGAPTLASGVERSFVISQAPCGIPATAKAYALNVTVVPRAALLSYITIWPTGKPQPFVSTLNSPDGRIKANAAVVPAGTGGAVSLMATDATDLVLDINGYFIEPSLNAQALAFYPVRPCRIADTREATGVFGGPVIPVGGSRNFPVLNASCGIPATARAYSLNVTVVPSGGLGYLTMWPTGQNQPYVSTLNAPTGAIVANAAIVPAGSNGEVSVFAAGQTHVVLDINGYFGPAGATDAQKFYPVSPCRLLDTREPNGEFGGPILAGSSVRNYTLPAATCGLSANARAFSLNATVVPTTTLGYMTLWPTGQTQPFVSTLNVTDDKIVANAAIVPAGTGGAIASYVTNQTHLVLDTNGYFAQ